MRPVVDGAFVNRPAFQAVAAPDDPISARPFGDVSDDELNSLVDDVLRSGKHKTLPAEDLRENERSTERKHARVIASHMQQLATTLSGLTPTGDAPRDQWYFEVGGRQIGPLTL